MSKIPPPPELPKNSYVLLKKPEYWSAALRGAPLREAGALVGAQLRKRTRSASRSATPKNPGARPGARAPTFMLTKN